MFSRPNHIRTWGREFRRLHERATWRSSVDQRSIRLTAELYLICTFECTVAVDSIDETERAVLANGGTIVMPRSVIVGVGTLIFFQDPEGNVLGAIQFDERAE